MYHFTGYVFLLPAIYVLLNILKQSYAIEKYKKQQSCTHNERNNPTTSHEEIEDVYKSLRSDQDMQYIIAFLYINLCISSILVHNENTMQNISNPKLKNSIIKYDDLMIFMINFYFLMCIIKVRSIVKRNSIIIGLGILIACLIDLKLLKKVSSTISQIILCFIQPIYVSIITSTNLILYFIKEKYLNGQWITIHRIFWHFIIALHSLYIINNILL